MDSILVKVGVLFLAILRLQFFNAPTNSRQQAGRQAGLRKIATSFDEVSYDFFFRTSPGFYKSGSDSKNIGV